MSIGNRALGLVFVLAFASLVSSAQAELLSSWEFSAGDLSGTNVAATSGSVGFGDARYTGSLQAGAAVAGGALQLDGSGDFLQFGNNLTEIRGLGAMTVAAWVQPASTTTGLRRIAEHEDNFYFWQDNGSYRYTTHGGSGTNAQAISTTAPSVGDWQHVAAVYEGGQPARIYVNGTPFEDASVSNQVAMPNNTETFQIGARRSGSGSASNFFDGQLDDVAIWNTPLSDGDISALAGQGSGGYAGRAAPSATSATTTTLAQWDFEELAIGSTMNTQRLLDSSGFGRDAFAGGGTGNTPPVVEGSGNFGSKALRFSGTTDEVIFRDGFNGFSDGPPAAGSDINFGQNDSFTVEAVIRAPAVPGSDGAGAIVSKDVGSNSPSWWLRILNDGTLQAIVDDSVGGNGVVAGSTAINDDEWHHVAFVRDAANDEVRLYIDHMLEAVAMDNTAGTSVNNNDIILGGFNDNTVRQFLGDIDVARISIGALSPDQFLQPIPEPASLLLWIGAGLGLVGFAAFRRGQLRRS